MKSVVSFFLVGCFFLTWLILINCNGVFAQKKDVMNDTIKFYHPGTGAKIDIFNPDILPIRSADNIPSLNNAVPHNDETSNSVQPFLNAEKNSRSGLILTERKFQVQWNSKLRSDSDPAFILNCKNRIIVEAGVWQLFSLDGKLIKEKNLGMSDILSDDKHNLFYYMVNSYGELTGCKYDDGSEMFSSSILFGEAFVRTLMVLRSQSIMLVENERQRDPHMNYVANTSIISKYGMQNIFRDHLQSQ